MFAALSGTDCFMRCILLITAAVIAGFSSVLGVESMFADDTAAQPEARGSSGLVDWVDTKKVELSEAMGLSVITWMVLKSRPITDRSLEDVATLIVSIPIWVYAITQTENVPKSVPQGFLFLRTFITKLCLTLMAAHYGLVSYANRYGYEVNKQAAVEQKIIYYALLVSPNVVVVLTALVNIGARIAMQNRLLPGINDGFRLPQRAADLVSRACCI